MRVLRLSHSCSAPRPSSSAASMPAIFLQHHDVLDVDALEVEDVHQHPLVAVRHRPCLPSATTSAHFFLAAMYGSPFRGSCRRPAARLAEQVVHPHDQVEDLRAVRWIERRSAKPGSRDQGRRRSSAPTSPKMISTTVNTPRSPPRTLAADLQSSRRRSLPRQNSRMSQRRISPISRSAPRQLSAARAGAPSRAVPEPVAVDAHRRRFRAREHGKRHRRPTRRPIGQGNGSPARRVSPNAGEHVLEHELARNPDGPAARTRQTVQRSAFGPAIRSAAPSSSAPKTSQAMIASTTLCTRCCAEVLDEERAVTERASAARSGEDAVKAPTRATRAA